MYSTGHGSRGIDAPIGGMNVIVKKLMAVIGLAVMLASCALPWFPVEIEVDDGSNYGAPQEVGIIDVQAGTKFLFFSNVGGGFSAVVRFQVPATGSYNIYSGGQPVFAIAVTRSSSGPTLAAPGPEETVTVVLEAGTNYFLEIEQGGSYAMGGSTAILWAD
jgi:hypothetical protein